jgi:hypothetical protein
VFFLSAIHGTNSIEYKSKKNITKSKPKVVMDYNFTMGGVDRVDKHLSNYPVARASGKKYYKKMFFSFIGASIVECFSFVHKTWGLNE